MVNANKHKQLKHKIGMLPTEDIEMMEKLVEKIVQDTNLNPQNTIDSLESIHDELNNYYETLSTNTDSILKIGTCQRILETYEHVLMIKETIQHNYHMLTIESNMIKAILTGCDRIFDVFKDIQIRQNKNIDKTGLDVICASESIENSDYPKEQFENIIRLKEPIIFDSSIAI